ncbi:hypothetical protein ACCQ07_05255 [Xanthomonas sp. NCPPB 3583]|uniref:hypothetical protein n=1 Tax=Xanthomonas sp. NCPPB 3583 TaxID=487558 RepID=UPI003557E29E
MANAAPATIFDAVQAKVLAAIGTGISEFEARSLRAEAEKLSRADPLSAIELKAMLAIADGRLEEADEMYARVLRASGNPLDRLLRYLSVLSRAGHAEQLGRVYRSRVNLADLAPHSRELMAKILGFCGWAVESTRIRRELGATGYQLDYGPITSLHFPDEAAKEASMPGEWIPRSQSIRDLTITEETMASLGTDDSWIAARVGDALQFFRSRAIDVLAVRSSPTPRESGEQGLLVNIYVNALIDEASDAEWEMFGYLCDRSPDILDIDGVGFAVVAAPEYS